MSWPPREKGECPRETAAESVGSDAPEGALTLSLGLEGPRWPCAAPLRTSKAGMRRSQKAERGAFLENSEQKERVSRGMLLTASPMVNSTC